MTALSVRGVDKSFGSVRALDDVSFDVERGSTAALLGPSGCGKTTLLRIIAGFERPDHGSVSVDDELVTASGIWKRPERRSIGYVSQEGALFPHLTVAGNIEFALTRPERRDGTRVAELLALVSLDPSQLTRFPHQLSGGQQQRVALARAMARRPGLMLLDEPFAALDASLRADTRDLMAAALAAEKVTTVLVTHDQEEALSFADHVVVLRDGRVRQSGGPREVYERPVDAWTAAFVGDAVLVPARLQQGRAYTALGVVPFTGGEPDGEGTVLLRPEQLDLTQFTGAVGSEDAIIGDVVAFSYRGHDTLASVTLHDQPEVTVACRIPGNAGWLSTGTRVAIRVLGGAVVVPDGDG
ncbi:MAG: ABC transporter ATP-binding protein [Nakamurella sp.]